MLKKIILFILLLSSVSVLAQEVTLTGTVKEANGTSVPGVAIRVKDSSRGTVSDIDGKFSLSVNPDETLVVSFVGYTTQEIPVDSRTSIDIIMTEDVSQLQEVVVTGYGSQSRKEITGAVAIVEPQELLAIPVTGVDQALQGRVPGVTVGAGGGPGGGVSVRIRGYGTIGNNDPLYVIDGMPTRGNLNLLNPNDIASLQVLKDAAAGSIYGARASNGVVIITTKQGVEDNEPIITFDSYYGTQLGSANFPKMMNPQQLANTLKTQAENSGRTLQEHPQYDANATLPNYLLPQGADGPGNTPYKFSLGSDKNLITKANKTGTDWYDEIFNDAPIQSYQIGMQGGTEKGGYFMSLNYFDQEGILIHTNFKRYTVRMNTNFKIKEGIRIGENFTFAYSQSTGINNQSTGNPVAMAGRMPSIVPVYDEGGNFAGTGVSGVGNASNPVADLFRAKDDVFTGLRAFGNAYLEADIIEGLTYKTSIGIDYSIGHGKDFNYPNPEAAEPVTNNSFRESTFYTSTWTWYNTLNYRKTFADVHTIKVLAGVEAIENNFRNFEVSKTNLFSESVDFWTISGGGNPVGNGDASSWSIFSLFGKLDYSYKDKYFASATFRRDGSSRFSKNNRFALFPAVSAGWRISEEDFFDVSFIDDMKLRVAWGQTGNQEIGNYPSFSSYASNARFSNYDISGANFAAETGVDQSASGNPDVKWETTTSLNIGLDITLLKNKLRAVIDWYSRETTDMLVQVTRPATQNISTNPFVNIGDVKNTGIDLGLTYLGTTQGGLEYTVGFNIFNYSNEVIKLGKTDNDFLRGNGARTLFPTRTQKGRPISSFYGYIVDGIFQNQAEVDAHADQTGKGVGRFKFRDLNGDGKIDGDDQDFIGDPHPDFSYGLNVELKYKGFDFTLFLQGDQGRDLFNFNKYFSDFFNFQGNRGVNMLDSWSESNRDAILPKLISGPPSRESESNTYFVEDGSYLRFKNIQLGYSLPESVLSKIGLKKARVYVQGQNLITITSYSGMDPEINNQNYFGQGADLDIGVERGAYPTSRTILLGVNLGF